MPESPELSRFKMLAGSLQRGFSRAMKDSTPAPPTDAEIRESSLRDGMANVDFRDALFSELKERIGDSDMAVAQGIQQESLAIMSQSYGAKAALERLLKDLEGLAE